MDLMRNGSIRYISMENWMAYTGPVVLQANPGVNIIAASNGSGKSAIVCAIALSLGFDLNILSRGDNIRSFVKRGCMKSTLKVGLADDKSKGGTIDIERRITLTENPLSKELNYKNKNSNSDKSEQITSKYSTLVKNEWFLNGKISNLDSIRSLYKRLKLQLDNLLTFLAQANVGKFAAMSQHELFRSTLNAIDPQYITDLDYLIDISQKLKSKISESKILEQELHSCNTKLSELKHISDTMVKVKDATLYRNIVKLKLNQMKESTISKGHENTRKRISDTNNDLYSSETKFKKLEARHKKMETTIRNLLKDSKTKIESANKMLEEDYSYLKPANFSNNSGNEPVDRAFYDSLSMLKTFSHDYKRAHSSLSINEETSESLKMKLDSVSQEINLIKSKMISNNDIVAEIASCKINEESLRYRLRKFNSRSTMNFQELQFESLMNHLPYMKRDLIRKYLNHCKTYSSTPYTIVVNDVKVRGRLNCSIVEDSIGNYLDCIVLKRSEYDKNLKILKDFRLPIVTEPNEKNVLCKVTEKMKKFGVKRFLHELLESSDMTVQCLSSLCQINEIFIVDENHYNKHFLSQGSSKNSEAQFNNFYKCIIDEISSQLGKKINTLKYFIGNKKHMYKHFSDSKYFLDSEVTVNTNPKVLVDYSSYGRDSNLKEQELIENELDVMVKKLYELNKKLTENNDINKHLNRKLYALTKQQISLEKSLKAIGNSDNERVTTTNWKQRLENIKNSRLKAITASIMTSGKNLLLKLERTTEMKNSLLEANETYNMYCNQVTDLSELSTIVNESKTKLDELKDTQRMLQNTFNEQKERIDEHNSIISELKQAIKTSEELFDSAFFNEDLTRNFAEIKKDFENKLINMSETDLEKELVKAEDHVRQLENDDFEEIQLMKMIQEQRNNKNKYTQDLLKMKEELAELTAERNSKFSVFNDNVKDLVKEIDKKFGKYMKYIGDGSDGQVRLELDQENIKDAKLRILVKFESEKDLLPLTTSHQSGGERGVTTMVYILSVQNLTKNPFFVIDEINQGLDSHYERKLMKLLLGTVNDSTRNSQNSQNDLPSDDEYDRQNMPQYFILTPQLISGYDLRNATLHFPLNGPGIGNDLTL